MKTIYKYSIETTDEQNINMPEMAEILTVQIQYGRPYIWALVDTENEQGVKTIEVFGTGNPIPDGVRSYIGTYQLLNGELIFHVFEKN